MKTKEIIEKQDELIARKCKHSPNCWLNQNWSEARMAMSDTPNEFRDAGYYEALQEIERKSQTCSCGVDDLYSELSHLKSDDIHDMRTDDNPFVVKCCQIAEAYRSQFAQPTDVSDEIILQIAKKVERYIKMNRSYNAAIISGHIAERFNGLLKAMRDGQIKLPIEDKKRDEDDSNFTILQNDLL